MSVRNISFCLVASFCLALFATGCKKSQPEQSSQNPPAQAASQPVAKLETVARIHWLGKKRIAAETNSASFMSIWNMPESQKLEAQTLDKFALAPWGLPREGTNTAAIVATNPPSVLLRPLIEDLLQEESYVEIRGAANQPAEIVVAVRVDENRSHLWKTNLTVALNSLTNYPLVAPKSDESRSPSTNHYPLFTSSPIFLRAGNWTVVVLAPSAPKTPASTLPQWVEQLANQLGQNSNLFAAEETNSWLETELDFNRISSALGFDWHLPDNMPKLFLTMGAEGELVRTTGRLNFEKPLPLELEPWNVPTNLIHDPLSSFTAIRGVKSSLSSLKVWNDLQLGPPPNQLYFWAQGNLPITTYWAAPLAGASNHIYQFTEHLIDDANPWLTNNSVGQFQRTTNANAAIWADLPFMEPYMRSISLPEGEFITGGVGATPSTNRPVPPGLFEQFLSRSNLVCYDWELTGARIDPTLYIIQFMRFVFQKGQVPADSLSLTWLKALEPKLGNSATMVALTRPDVLSFVRRSSIGFTAIELQIFADWLESPQFPHNLTTFVAPPAPLPTRRHRTNSVPDQPPGK